MARPRKEGMDYFPHDVNASEDRKLQILIASFGNDGYAFYFIMLEQIYKEKNFEIDLSDSEIKNEILKVFSKKCNMSFRKFLRIFEKSLSLSLFCNISWENRNVITSNAIKKRASVVIEKRQKMRDKYHLEVIEENDNKGVSASETEEETGVSVGVSDIVSVTEMGEESTQRKEKKRKEKKSKSKVKESIEKEKKAEKKESEGSKNMEIERINEKHINAAFKLKKYILSYNPKCKVPLTLNKWADTIRLMFEQDKRTVTEFENILDFIFKEDDFWCAQIQSAQSLRKHWDKIWAKKMLAEKKANKPSALELQAERMKEW